MSTDDCGHDECSAQAWKDSDVLSDLYIDDGKSRSEIAVRYGVSEGAIQYWLEKYGISRDRPWREKEVLEELYISEGLPLHEVGDRLGCSRQCIATWMDRFNIPRRSSGAHQTPPRLRDKDWLHDQYVNRELSTSEIASLADTTTAAVCRWLDRHGIDSRDRLDADTANALADEVYLRTLYIDKELSQKAVAKEVGCSQPTICKWLRVHGIETRDSYHPGGEDHPSYKGGWDRYYGPSWNSQRRKRLELDGHTCQRCSISEEDHRELTTNNRGLDVHHIIPFRTFDSHEDANELQNLISLCSTCHVDMEGLPIDNRVPRD